MQIALDQIAWRDMRGRPVRLAIVGGSVVARPVLGRGVKDWVVWASGKTNYLISKILNWFYNAASFTPAATHYAALWTTTLTAASTGSSGTEASYTSYARVAITANTTNFPTSSSGAAIQNATAITFPANTGSLNTCTFFAICDASSAGNMTYWGSITSTAVNPGDTPQVNINGLTASEA